MEIGNALGSLLSPALLGRLAGAPISAPIRWQSTGAILSIDISGFSALTESLGANSSLGAEALARHLKQIFGPVILAIRRNGGQIEQFAGDNILAAWDGDCEQQARRANACAQEMLNDWINFQKASPRPLGIRLGVGTGVIHRAVLGGTDKRYCYLIGGDAISRAQHAEDNAPVNGIKLDSGITDSKAAPPGDADPALAANPISSIEVAVAPETFTALVPDVLRDLMQAGSDWLSEFRRVQVLFADLGPDGLSGDEPDTFTEMIAQVQAASHATGGTILQIAIEHGRHVLVAAWGVVGSKFEDDTDRALQTALAINRSIIAAGRKGSVGVSQGRVFCGFRGNEERREYAVIGSTVNRAARIMQNTDGEVVCDLSSCGAASPRFVFESIGEVRLRGFAQPVTFYRVGSVEQTSKAAKVRLVDRDYELDLLRTTLGSLQTFDGAANKGRGESAIGLIIEGEAGYGKSGLLTELLEMAKESLRPAYVSLGLALTQNVAYHAWRPVLNHLANTSPQDDADITLSKLASLVEDLPNGLERLPLLNEVVAARLPESRITAQLEGQTRTDATIGLIVEIVSQACGQQPILIVCDDAHWFDSASWQIAAALLRAQLPLMLVFAHRPLSAPLLPAVQEALAPLTTVRLKHLSKEAARFLVRRTLGTDQVPEVVYSWILDRAAGHPFFIEELTRALVDTGKVIVVGDHCTAVGQSDTIANVDLPISIEDVITSRVDSLPGDQRLALRVASVIGRLFSLEMLSAVHPTRASRDELQLLVARLQDKGLVEGNGDAEITEFRFHHALICDCVYEGLLFAQRRQLHSNVASLLEMQASNDDSQHALLAHHWFGAGELTPATQHASKAGALALRSGAYREALGFYSRLLDITDQAGELPAGIANDENIAQWQAGKGEAIFALGDYRGASSHFRETLTRLGAPAPNSNVQWTTTLLSNLVRQIWYRWRPPQTQRSVLRHAAHAAERLSERGYFERTPIPMVSASLLATNLSARSGSQGDLSRSYSMLSVILCVAGVQSLSRRYHKLALQAAHSASDLGAEVFAGYTRSVALSGTARFDDAREVGESALVLSRSLGNNEDIEMCLCAVGNVSFFTGAINQAQASFESVIASATLRSNGLHESWGHYAVARGMLVRGEFDLAEPPLRRALLLLERNSEEVSKLICHGLLAELLFATGRHDQALEEARQALRLIRSGPPTVLTERDGYAGAASVLLALWEHALEGRLPLSPQLQQEALDADKAMARFAGTFAIGKPRAALIRGRRLWLQGNTAKAQRVWEDGLEEASRLDMPIESALLHRELGWRECSDPERSRTHRENALAIFDKFQCQPNGTTAASAAFGANYMQSPNTSRSKIASKTRLESAA